MTALHWLTIEEASGLIARSEVSASELLQATLTRIEETDSQVHAYVRIMEEDARAEAKRADAELKSGPPRSALHGIPIGVKDVCYTKGIPTEAGSRVLAGFIPDRDARVVERLRSAGAVIVGKTVTHEFGWGQDVPPTRNAWDQTCYPGGSSAGSGVAVAVGSAFGAIGTDAGGSIRCPAAVNGVVGLKPTHGRVSRDGVLGMSPTLDAVGPLTRTVKDAALILQAIAGGSPGDTTAIDEPVPNYAENLTQRLDGVRLGVERDYFFYATVLPEVRDAVESAIERLAALGATIVEIEIDHLEYVSAAGLVILLADTSDGHRQWLRDSSDKYVQGTRVMLELGELVSATVYARAQKVRTLVRNSLRTAFETNMLDAIVAPTLPISTIPLEDLSRDLAGSGEIFSALLHHCFVANVVGIPALSVPCGFTSMKLPVGLHLFGRPFDEGQLLRIGHAYQTSTDWHDQHAELEL